MSTSYENKNRITINIQDGLNLTCMYYSPIDVITMIYIEIRISLPTVWLMNLTKLCIFENVLLGFPGLITMHYIEKLSANTTVIST